MPPSPSTCSDSGAWSRRPAATWNSPAGRAEDALGAVREALRLWRGEPLQDAAYEPFVVADVERLHELRAAALACEIDARMALGDHDGVVPELRQLVADFPFRERFWGQLILALYRCGRQAEALRAFDAARRRLVDELGVEPGPELQSLHRAVLEHRPGLEWTPPSDAEQAAAVKESEPGGDAERATRARPRPLPATITRLIGRERELTRICEAMVDSRMVTLTGPGGAGKTRLALAVAHAEARRRPVWLVELAEIADPAVVPLEIARAVGVTSSTDPLEGVSLSIGHRAGLLVLDTYEHQLKACARAAYHLLRSCPSLGMLATSRQPTGVVGEVAWPVPPLGVPTRNAPFSSDTLVTSIAVGNELELAHATK